MTQRKWPMIAAAAVVLIGIVAVILITRTTPCCATEGQIIEDIAPAAYVEQFANGSADHVLIDVRTPEEFASGHIAGAVNIPVDALSSRLSEVSRDQTVVVYCRSGNRSATASQILAQAGYSDVRDLGGIITWSEQGYPVQ